MNLRVLTPKCHQNPLIGENNNDTKRTRQLKLKFILFTGSLCSDSIIIMDGGKKMPLTFSMTKAKAIVKYAFNHIAAWSST